MSIRRRLLAAALVTSWLAVGGLASERSGTLLNDGKPVSVEVQVIDRFKNGSDQIQFGDLTFLGGLELIPPPGDLGGLSALLALNSGSSILSISDNGLWFASDIVEDDTGKPLGLQNPRIAVMRGKAGRNLRADWGHDTEAMARATVDGEERLLVSAERANRIYVFPWPLESGDERILADLPVPQGIKNLRGSKGLEAIAVAPSDTPLSGTLVAIAERGRTDAHDIPVFLLGGPTPGELLIRKSDRYDVTDAVFLPGGDLLVLERRFNLRDWVGMRLRRFQQDELKPGALAEGTIVMEADYGHQIDNMEGLAWHRSADGAVILSLISDNNRSVLQRTLLLRFKFNESRQ